MDPLDLNRMIEKAKAEASATGAIEAPHKDILDGLGEGLPREVLASEHIEKIVEKIDGVVQEDELVEAMEKKAAAERKRHMYIAKLLTAIDTMSELGR